MFILDLFGAAFALTLATITCAGWGNLTARICRLKIESINMEQLWLGFAVVLTLIVLISFFGPINWTNTIGLVIIGTISFSMQLSQHLNPRRSTKAAKPSLKPISALLILLVVSFWAIKAMESPRNYDSGLYHFNSIRWINEYGLVAGLGNLHDRLAFNQSWFDFVAFLNFYPAFNKGYAVAGLFILCTSVAQLFISYRKTQLPLLVFFIFLIPILLNLRQISSPSPDIPTNILQVVISVLILQLLREDTANKDGKELQITTIVALCISLAAIKLSGAAFAGAALILTLLVSSSYLSINRIAIISILSISLYSPTLVRGYLLSGAPLFPSTFAAYEKFNWSMDLDAIKNIANAIYCWAVNPVPECMKSLGNWEWLGEWWQRFPLHYFLSLLFSAVMIVTPFIFRRFFSINKNAVVILWSSIPSLVGLIVWFFLAPNPRFLGATAFVLSGLSMLFCATASTFHLKHKLENISYALVIVFVFSIVTTPRSLSLDSLKSILLSGFQPIRSVGLIERKTTSGLSVYTPDTGDQCFDSPLPCTPYFDANLRFEANKSDYPNVYFTKRIQ
jgi:hypothetical protein